MVEVDSFCEDGPNIREFGACLFVRPAVCSYAYDLIMIFSFAGPI